MGLVSVAAERHASEVLYTLFAIFGEGWTLHEGYDL